MRVTLIHNPGAGNQADGDARALVELLRAAGHEVRDQAAGAPGWEAALQWPADLVAVAGGDGTIARVAKHLVGRAVPLAPLPAGTANNIAHTLELVERPWEELVRGWPRARRVQLDVGTASGPWGSARFLEGVGCGLFACLLGSFDPAGELARITGPAARVERALEILRRRARDCEAVELQASLDGRDISGRYLLVEAVNLRYVGPNLFLGLDSEPGDGTFDVVVVTEAERERLENYLASWQENRERLAVLPTHRGRRLRFEWTGFELHIDDELVAPGRGPVELTVGDAAVEFLAPDPAPRTHG